MAATSATGEPVKRTAAYTARPASEPNVPGANGTYPTPSAVATASESDFTKDGSSVGGNHAGTRETVMDAPPCSVEEQRQQAQAQGDGTQQDHHAPQHGVP